MDTDVLIVGAGPTGLVLALWLARSGIRIRIVDRAPEPGKSSRALAVQARTLELYRQLGFVDEIIEAGLPLTAVNFWARDRKTAHIDLGELDRERSPFPYGLIYPQDQHERFLIDRLAALGVRVEGGNELTDLLATDDEVVAQLGQATCKAAFLAACDGARSTVREKLAIGFPGGTYQHLFYVADVEASGPLLDGELHVSVDTSDFTAVFPLAEKGRVRLIGTVRPDAHDKGDKLGWEDVSQGLLRRLQIDVRRVNWFSTYHVHHRVASHFRQGRVFLLGDAAHVHSPVGGQGMNTGIGDAANLGWKLADVLRGRAPVGLLDSYEPERIAFARRLVATTDRIFELVSRPGRAAATVRVHLVPRLIATAFKFSAARRFLFRTVSQTAITYRGSSVSEGHAGAVYGGDRLPWLSEPDNFAPLQSLDWQVHVYGHASPELSVVCAARGLALHVFPWTEQASRAGFARDANYLIRPDGHVAYADLVHSPARLERFLDTRGLRLVPKPEPANVRSSLRTEDLRPEASSGDRRPRPA